MRNKDVQRGDLEGLLDKGTTFSGEISFHDTLRIDGIFKGTIFSGQTLVIGESADINGEIEVENISVGGLVRGRLSARSRIELLSTARAECELDCKVLVVHEGAVFDGQCAMSTKNANDEISKNDNVKEFKSTEQKN